MSPRNIFETADMKNHRRRRCDCDDSHLQFCLHSEACLMTRQQPCRQLHPISRGKSLVPTTKRKSKDTGAPQGITRKRRRCLPLSKTAVRIKKNFPGKLFKLVESCTLSKDPILSWLASKNHAAKTHSNTRRQKMQSLVVWDKDRFLDHHLVKTSFASQSTFRSFERQLNSWGFKRDHTLEDTLLANQQQITEEHIILTKESLRAFYHPGFQEGRPDFLQGVKRRPPGSGNKGIKQTIVASNVANVATTTKTTAVTTKKKEEDHSAATSDDSSPSSGSSICSSTHDESIRADICLPSGACLRINRRIPDWAIPAQEAAIQYLFQKHSGKQLHGKPLSKEHSQQATSVKYDERRRSRSRVPCDSDNQNSLASQEHPRLAKEQEVGLLAFSRQEPKYSLGSLLQSQRPPLNAEFSVDDDRFNDASEDDDEEMEAALLRNDDRKEEGKGETGYFKQEDHSNDDDKEEDDEEKYLVI